nr:hypothetical protein GCM10020093_101320 [Planobispora longispora]
MRTLTDQIIARPDFAERHEITITASRERVWDAVTTLNPTDLRAARPLFAIRELASRLRGGHGRRGGHGQENGRGPGNGLGPGDARGQGALRPSPSPSWPRTPAARRSRD